MVLQKKEISMWTQLAILKLEFGVPLSKDLGVLVITRSQISCSCKAPEPPHVHQTGTKEETQFLPTSPRILRKRGLRS